jgi:hypothetical protein
MQPSHLVHHKTPCKRWCLTPSCPAHFMVDPICKSLRTVGDRGSRLDLQPTTGGHLKATVPKTTSSRSSKYGCIVALNNCHGDAMRFAGSINRDYEVRPAVRPPGIRFQQACVDSQACPLQAKRCSSLTASVRQSAATRERNPHDVLFHRATRRVGPNVALHRGRLLVKGRLLAATLATFNSLPLVVGSLSPLAGQEGFFS